MQGELNIIIIPCWGGLKRSQVNAITLTPLASSTTSGIQIREWVKRLVLVRSSEGQHHGPAFCDSLGNIAHSKEYELALMDRLSSIQRAQPQLSPPEFDVYEHFGISQSFH